ncbi:MAG TPA: ABC transporter permease, partial [Hyphomicrobiaceae bacterium]|nr:ABC transporter permease [Hyphomicrobiaceae bacterium]
MWTRLAALIVKELLAAFRDPRARMALVAPPIMQLFLFAYAATMEVSNVPIGVLNQDWGIASERLISRFERASAFSEIRRYASPSEVKAAIDRQEVMIVVHIDQEFSRRLAAGQPAAVQLLLDGRKSNSAQLVNNYVTTIVRQFSEDFAQGQAAEAPSELIDRSWYNPNREYRIAMVPTLIGVLSMIMVLTVVGLSVARERELGTFEQLLVSPLQPLEIVIGKAVPGLI